MRPFKKLKLENKDKTNKIKKSLGDSIKKKLKIRQKLRSQGELCDRNRSRLKEWVLAFQDSVHKSKMVFDALQRKQRDDPLLPAPELATIFFRVYVSFIVWQELLPILRVSFDLGIWWQCFVQACGGPLSYRSHRCANSMTPSLFDSHPHCSVLFTNSCYMYLGICFLIIKT